MTKIFSDLVVATQRYGNLDPSDSQAWALATCAYCGGSQMAVVACTQNGGTKWLRCTNCRLGVVEEDGAVSPPVLPLRTPRGLKGVELAAWKEVRKCLSVGADTAAAMMCRKLLFHVAVAHDLPEKNAKGRAPTFMQAVKHLEEQGLITKRMRPWVDRIKDVGNEATHDITPVNPDVALDVATFTEQLLILAYEMDALMTGADVEPAAVEHEATSS